MKLTKLKLRNFRNHKDLTITFDGKSKVIRGVNGVGKSNILEAIQLVSTTKSLRANRDHEMVMHQEELARVEIQTTTGDGSTNLELVLAKTPNGTTTKKLVKINRVKKALKSFSGTLTSVLFTPTDIEVLTGSPSLRRRYIDSIFFQIDKEYKTRHNQYLKAVRQRNKVLESIRDLGQGHDQLPFWNQKVLELGTHIQRKRQNFFDFTQNNIKNHEKKLNTKNVNYEIVYRPSEITNEKLTKYEPIEIAAKRTLVGPHKDEFTINFNNSDIASFGSRGQQRTTILALKLCELDFITEKTNNRPVLLLDDIFSELDPLHKDAVKNIIPLQQTIVTTALNAKGEISIENI